ncbi:unnamed protein product [Ixodes pacificus]
MNPDSLHTYALVARECGGELQLRSASLNIPDQLAKTLSHDMPVRGRGGQLKCDSTKKKRETTLHQRRLQENAANTNHNPPTKKKSLSLVAKRRTRKKSLLVHPIMTTGIHRSFVPPKLTCHKKTSPVGERVSNAPRSRPQFRRT